MALSLALPTAARADHDRPDLVQIVNDSSTPVPTTVKGTVTIANPQSSVGLAPGSVVGIAAGANGVQVTNTGSSPIPVAGSVTVTNAALPIVGREFGVQLHDVPSKAGEKETFTYSPAKSQFAFSTTAASKPFNVQVLVRHAGKSVRTAQITGTGLRNASLAMEFDAAKETFTYKHTGAAPAAICARARRTSGRPPSEMAT